MLQSFCQFTKFPYMTNINIKGTLLQHHQEQIESLLFKDKIECNLFLIMDLIITWRKMLISRILKNYRVPKNQRSIHKNIN